MVTALLTSRRDQSVEQGWPNHSFMAICCSSALDVASEASMKKVIKIVINMAKPGL